MLWHMYWTDSVRDAPLSHGGCSLDLSQHITAVLDAPKEPTMTEEGTSPPRPPLLRRSPPRHELPAQPDRSAHRRIDETNRLLAARIDALNRRINETNRRIDETNRSLWQQILEVSRRMDTNFLWITTVVVIGGTLIAVMVL